jgi:hypothetical protein
MENIRKTYKLRKINESNLENNNNIILFIKIVNIKNT